MAAHPLPIGVRRLGCRVAGDRLLLRHVPISFRLAEPFLLTADGRDPSDGCGGDLCDLFSPVGRAHGLEHARDGRPTADGIVVDRPLRSKPGRGLDRRSLDRGRHASHGLRLQLIRTVSSPGTTGRIGTRVSTVRPLAISPFRDFKLGPPRDDRKVGQAPLGAAGRSRGSNGGPLSAGCVVATLVRFRLCGASEPASRRDEPGRPRRRDRIRFFPTSQGGNRK